MKLTKVTAYAVRTPPPNLGGYRWYFIKLETDAGHVGWGECAVLFSMYDMEQAFDKLVQNTFSRYLDGANPLNRSVLTKQLYERLTSENAGFFISGIISAFDMAMWDITGKHFGAPICDLLGGRFRDKIRAYTYVYNVGTDGSLVDAIAAWRKNPKMAGECAKRLADEGFTGLKLDPVPYNSVKRGAGVYPKEITLKEYDSAERTIEAIRNAVGNDCDILIGTHGQITPSAARRLAKRLEPFDPLWLEEPCPPENVQEMARIAASTSIPIATGERLAWGHGFRPLFEAGACHFAQPDLGSCGGITAAREIAAMAETHYVLMAPHVWGGPLITAAALQLDASIPNFLIQESIYKSGLFFDEICVERIHYEDGYLSVPEGPGLGINLNEEALAKYVIS